MFAIFLMKDMDPFYQNISSFPTVIFTFLLAIVTLYWLVAVLGFVDLDFLDFSLPDADQLSAEGHSHTTPDVLAGLMLRLGLQGVPVTVIVSLITLFGWFICYYAVHLMLSWLPAGILHFIVGLPILLASVYAAAMLTAQAIKPLRPLFKNAQLQTVKHILGQTAVVRSSRVDGNFGEAIFEDGGAGLLLSIRSTGSATFNKGDRVVLLEHIKEQGVYRVISEAEFLGNDLSH
ncbi:MAG: DUF1449 domain-containing protein [Zhongshania sp.]|uniref:DUF1449 domain-containing protein n=1 Tax=Zhongshania sp. TaxID=1971902 RepID=UPI00262ABE9E|nr:DUF1449 domain-containing protein [Zhongshania sp.]MDF1693670.1 DUF1449 domain-containing protein [Zhongshania sp.]